MGEGEDVIEGFACSVLVIPVKNIRNAVLWKKARYLPPVAMINMWSGFCVCLCCDRRMLSRALHTTAFISFPSVSPFFVSFEILGIGSRFLVRVS